MFRSVCVLAVAAATDAFLEQVELTSVIHPAELEAAQTGPAAGPVQAAARMLNDEQECCNELCKHKGHASSNNVCKVWGWEGNQRSGYLSCSCSCKHKEGHKAIHRNCKRVCKKYWKDHHGGNKVHHLHVHTKKNYHYHHNKDFCHNGHNDHSYGCDCTQG